MTALDDVSLTVEHGGLTALVGPDGAGKTTLIRLMAGLITADAGALTVLGIDIAHDPQAVQDRVGYMPQKFGLYEDLTVQENLDLYADLHGVTAAERRQVYPQLMDMTALGPFAKRLAGRLSGGMKQKLGLACTLVRAPDLLLLDEPTVGVDPLSRRELWEIILHLVNDQGLTVLISTSYLDEAERCKHAVVMHEGTVLAKGAPQHDHRDRGRPLLPRRAARGRAGAPAAGAASRRPQRHRRGSPGRPRAPGQGRRRRTCRYRSEPGQAALRGRLHGAAAPGSQGGKAASLSLGRGRRGTMATPSSKSATWCAGSAPSPPSTPSASRSRPARSSACSDPTAPARPPPSACCAACCRQPAAPSVAGVDLRTARASARQRIGYVAQKFSLYGQLSVTQNLEFFAGAYGLPGRRRKERIDWAMEQFDLAPLASLPSGQLPGGYKQRLAMAAALIHEPEILFLDEPTSGADPLARREFWRRITALAEQGVTVIVTTHFMEEAEYCDRVVIMDAGQVLARGTPAEIRAHAPESGEREPTMEDAFIAIVEEARREHGRPGERSAA